jgi:hypothetical protein|tara:strand:- start:5059 stop:5304 length:246 start_codon:yes stop_codon:yes gene_type:complete
MEYTILKYTWDVYSVLIGFGIGFLFYFLIYLIFGKRKKGRTPSSFIGVRNEIKKGYDGLQVASKSLQNLYSLMDEVEDAKG